MSDKVVTHIEVMGKAYSVERLTPDGLRELQLAIRELEDINARLNGDMQEPVEYNFPEALRIAELWRAGKLIGGDQQGVINALLHEIEIEDPNYDGY